MNVKPPLNKLPTRPGQVLKDAMAMFSCRQWRTWFLTALFLWAATLHAPGFGFYHASGNHIVDSQGRVVQLRGVGLGGWLFPEGYMLHMPGFGSPSSIRAMIEELIGPEATREFYQVYETNYVNEKDVEQIARWGFDHIRLPFSYRLFYDEANHSFDEAGFARFETFLGWCKNNGLLVVLDMHGAPGGQNASNISDSDGEEARLWTDTTNQTLAIQIWREIARRYAGEEAILGYDLLNEPVLPPGYPNTVLRNFYVRATAAIREVDPNHLVFIEGNWFATDFTHLTPPFDSNMAYSFHKYWSETDQSTIQYLLDIRDTYNVPLWMGESGENSNPWFAETVRLLENNQIDWCWWTHKKVATTTSPLSAEMTPEYRQLLDYWAGRATRPSAQFARDALLAMAENLAIERCRLNEGVLRALFDPDFLIQPSPFPGNQIPGVVEAVHYDFGTQGLAYSDTDFKRVRWDVFEPWNIGGEYRNDGVDIELSQDGEGPRYSVGWIQAGEWLRYSLEVTHDVECDVFVRVASANGEGRLRLTLDGRQVGADVDVPATGDWHRWETIPVGTVQLSGEKAVLTCRALKSGFNLSQILFIPRAEQGFQPVGSAVVGPSFPNPFNNAVHFPLILPARARVRLEIFDSLGRKVIRLVDQNLEPGNYSFRWEPGSQGGRSAASGIYFYRLTIGKNNKVGRLVLQR
ncbi:MAG: carbohydrate-binding protein [Calditrichaeota bacterium]|nr:MAG: carbohydrate-binding protein [Calditrichota bacterium]